MQVQRRRAEALMVAGQLTGRWHRSDIACVQDRSSSRSKVFPPRRFSNCEAIINYLNRMLHSVMHTAFFSRRAPAEVTMESEEAPEVVDTPQEAEVEAKAETGATPTDAPESTEADEDLLSSDDEPEEDDEEDGGAEAAQSARAEFVGNSGMEWTRTQRLSTAAVPLLLVALGSLFFGKECRLSSVKILETLTTVSVDAVAVDEAPRLDRRRGRLRGHPGRGRCAQRASGASGQAPRDLREGGRVGSGVADAGIGAGRPARGNRGTAQDVPSRPSSARERRAQAREAAAVSDGAERGLRTFPGRSRGHLGGKKAFVCDARDAMGGAAANESNLGAFA
eukprot:scaffold374_cov271-Pinguiococcus_pyrenoidosus.AAC.7